jgi:CheY-like chemotaxis protein
MGNQKTHVAHAASQPGRLRAKPKDLFVLHLEDNPDDSLLLKLAWEQTGCPVTLKLVESAAQAIAYFSSLLNQANQTPRFPDLAVLDLFLPARSGLELLRYIRMTSQFQDLPVVILTGNNNRNLAEEACSLGADSVVFKTVSFQETVSSLAELHRCWYLTGLQRRSRNLGPTTVSPANPGQQGTGVSLTI